MTAIGPYSKSYDNTHMYSFVDYRHPVTINEFCIPDDTIMGYIRKHPDFQKIKRILCRANLVGVMSDPQLDITLFVPIDKFIEEPCEFFDNIDPGMARDIINVSSLKRKINGELVRSSPVCYFTTRDPYRRNQMYVTNISGITKINNCAQVVHYDINLSNGIIHVVDKLLNENSSPFLN